MVVRATTYRILRAAIINLEVPCMIYGISSSDYDYILP
jgi:hypothetical protein